MRPRVYISGPITFGNQLANLKQATGAMRKLLAAGFAPFCPHLSMHLEWAEDVEHADWMAMDLPWISQADLVVRLPGESKGADEECALAKSLGIPVKPLEESLMAGVKAFERHERHPLSERFHAILEECGRLHDEKQRDYGVSSDPFANVRASQDWGIDAWLGALMRAGDKVSRLKTYARTRSLANEGVEDSLKDLAVYAIIALVLFEEQQAVATEG